MAWASNSTQSSYDLLKSAFKKKDNTYSPMTRNKPSCREMHDYYCQKSNQRQSTLSSLAHRTGQY